MKRSYDSPEMRWVPIRSSHAVAEVCWGFAMNTKPFYYNTYGTGYAELYAVGNRCDSNITFDIRYYPDTMSQEDRDKAVDELQHVIAVAKATSAKHPSPYKGSVFSPTLDPTWS